MSRSAFIDHDRLGSKMVTDPFVPRSRPVRTSTIAPASGGETLLQVRELRKSYSGLEAVSGVNLTLPVGRISGLIGPNGAGKTTLLNIISRVERADAGNVTFLGEDISSLPQHHLATRGLVRTFQISRELGRLTVLENMLLARPKQTGEKLINILAQGKRIKQEEDAAIEIARAALLRVNLWQLADAPAANLSGGQKKLLELSRALMLRPRLVLLDEPAAGVSPAMEEILIDAVRGLTAEGVDFVIIEHDLDVVAALCDHVYVMAGGRILAEGSFAEVVADSRVVEAYLGLKA